MKKWFLFCLLGLSSMTFAIDLELTQGVIASIPLAIELQNDDPRGQEIANILKHDFDFSGQFRLVSAGGNFPTQALDVWQRMGADHLVSLQITPLSGNRYTVSYELKDVALKGQVSGKQQFQINANQARALTHHIADEVYRQVTGTRGVFSTKLAYIKVLRQGGASRFTLEVSDLDGFNPRELLISNEPIMSPTWSPDGRSIAYVSFERKKPQIYQVLVESGQRRLITDFAGINGAPAWSPDGHSMAVVLSKSGSPKIYLVSLDSGSMKQMTFGNAIDTEPRFAPDGRSIVFTSGRDGTPQIYRLSLSDGSISRLTYDGNYNARGSLTPNNQELVMSHRQEDKSFNIGVQSLGQTQITSLTHSSLDESPSVAPNGKMVVYATQLAQKGILGIVSIDGLVQIKLPARDGDVQEPAWSPFLG